jgi:predicted nuclease with RNAse H fold
MAHSQSTSTAAVSVGIDVGADRLHIVAISPADHGDPSSSLQIAWSAVVDPESTTDVDELIATIPVGSSVGIDGPAGVSTAPHRADLSLAPKFRTARGCEVQLGRRRGIWVSWATPTADDALPRWMHHAIELHDRCRAVGLVALETYPYAIFHTLAGRRPPKKTTGAGLAARVALLSGAGISAAHLPLWSHDALDALACALVAHRHARGTAEAVDDPNDASAIWLPL